jgi:hypothetical protein
MAKINKGLEGTAQTQIMSGSSKIYMPTPKQLAEAYRSTVAQAESKGTAKQLTRAPAGADKAQGIDITEPRRLGASRTAYVIGGTLYVKSTILSPTAKPSWEKIGPAPLF